MSCALVMTVSGNYRHRTLLGALLTKSAPALMFFSHVYSGAKLRGSLGWTANMVRSSMAVGGSDLDAGVRRSGACGALSPMEQVIVMFSLDV